MLSRLNWIRGAAVALAALGTMVPHEPLMAASKPGAGPVIKTVDAKVLDVALSTGGTFTGRVVDHTGAATEGAQVTVKRGKAEVAHSITDASGLFVISGLKEGTYEITTGATTGVYRVWNEKTAPPSANSQGILITGKNGARGQFAAVDGGGNLLIAAVTLVTLGIAIATLIEVEDVKSTVNNLPQSP